MSTSPEETPRPNSPSRIGVFVTAIVVAVLVAIIVPALYQAREAARRTQSQNNLKQLGLAMHNYHDTFNQFPPGGVLNAEGVAFHEWTSFIAPYLDASPWYNGVDFNIPWDHPEQVDWFRNSRRGRYFANPSLSNEPRVDGLTSNHYAGSQVIFHRNSSVSIKELDGTSQRLLIADALDQFVPVGYPYGWRDVTLGLGTDPEGFGCRPRGFTQCLMADGSVRTLGLDVDDEVLSAMNGPPNFSPTAEQVRKPTNGPSIDLKAIWKVEMSLTEKDRIVIRRTSPDGKTVKTRR